jgi:hypothetical protein
MQATTSKYLWTILLLFLFCTGMAVTLVRAAVPQRELDALVDLYDNTNGSGWRSNTNWKNGDPCTNNWQGVTCNADNTHVTGLDFFLNNLNGTLPASIDDLANLQYLYLHQNQLSGNIPASIGSLTNLQFLYLDSNQLCGVIPTALMNLTNLYNRFGLSLSDNNLDTEVSTDLGAFISQKSSSFGTGQPARARLRSAAAPIFPGPCFCPP